MIGAGSFVGGVLRYLLSRWVVHQVGGLFPWGTFVVNILGCFLVGLLYGLCERQLLLNPEWRLCLIVGFCGSFTTFSSFINEGTNLLVARQFPLVVLYMMLSLGLGLLATYLGFFLLYRR